MARESVLALGSIKNQRFSQIKVRPCVPCPVLRLLLQCCNLYYVHPRTALFTVQSLCFCLPLFTRPSTSCTLCSPFRRLIFTVAISFELQLALTFPSSAIELPLFPMPERKSPEDVFKRARKKGTEIQTISYFLRHIVPTRVC